MRKKNSFRHESLQDAESIQKILQALSEGLASGELTFSDEEDEIVLQPNGLMRMKLSADQEDNRNRVTLRINWENDDGLKKNKKLNVSSKK